MGERDTKMSGMAGAVWWIGGGASLGRACVCVCVRVGPAYSAKGGCVVLLDPDGREGGEATGRLWLWEWVGGEVDHGQQSAASLGVRTHAYIYRRKPRERRHHAVPMCGIATEGKEGSTEGRNGVKPHLSLFLLLPRRGIITTAAALCLANACLDYTLSPAFYYNDASKQASAGKCVVCL